MRKKRNHTGTGDRSEQPPNVAPAQVKAEYRLAVNTWLERKNTCVSAIYETLGGVQDALEITNQYILEKEILPQMAQTRRSWPKLLNRLIDRFKGEIHNELGDLNKILPILLLRSKSDWNRYLKKERRYNSSEDDDKDNMYYAHH